LWLAYCQCRDFDFSSSSQFSTKISLSDEVPPIKRMNINRLSSGETSYCLRFGLESLRAEDCAELGLQNFERNFALVAEIARELHGRHSADTDLALEGVANAQGALERLEDRHRAPR
jgi:hypothetical protein